MSSRLQLVPGDLVVDPGVHDVAGPLDHALDHMDDVLSETLISKLHFLNFFNYSCSYVHNLHFLALLKLSSTFLWERKLRFLIYSPLE